jgi:hypothetical protein
MADERGGGVAPERSRRRRNADAYEQELKRHELAAARALAAVVPDDRPANARELGAAHRAMTQALYDLRRLARDLDAGIEELQARPGGTRRPAGAEPAAAARRPPEELYRLEAVRNAIEEVVERWEARRAQLEAAVDRLGGPVRDGGRRQVDADPRSSTGRGGGQGRGGRPGDQRRGQAPAESDRPRGAARRPGQRAPKPRGRRPGGE